jgi:hypothetical protein
VNDKATKGINEKDLERDLDKERSKKSKNNSLKGKGEKYVDIREIEEEQNSQKNMRKKEEKKEEKNDARLANNKHQEEENMGFGPLSQPIKGMQDKGVPNESGNALIGETIGLNTRKVLPEIQLENGAVYKGEWKNGLRDGYGIQIWPDGSKYEGGIFWAMGFL